MKNKKWLLLPALLVLASIFMLTPLFSQSGSSLTIGTILATGGITDTSLITSLKRVHWAGKAVTASNFSISSGWGTALPL
ncbi:MAG: hypothetical protein WBC04_24165 [Candidatus Acidiferrales bacterium]